MVDMTRCPQSDEEMRDYFYALIGKVLGTPANDYEVVLARAYPWDGQMLMIPPGVGPGIMQPPDAPFFGLTQQFSGVPKGRVFLPSNQPDANGFYTRADQYLDDAAQTYSKSKKAVSSSAQGLVWAWYYVDGHAYAPVQPGDGSQPPVSSGGLTEAQVQAMIDDSIQQAIAGFQGVVFGDKIALRTNSGLLQGIKGGGPTEADKPIELIGKTGDAHAWESYTIEKGE